MIKIDDVVYLSLKDLENLNKDWIKYREDPAKFIDHFPKKKKSVFAVFNFTYVANETDYILSNTSRDSGRDKEVIAFNDYRNRYGFDSGYWLHYDKWLLDNLINDVIEF